MDTAIPLAASRCTPLRLSPRWLVLLHGLLPLAVLFAVADTLFWDGAVGRVLPRSPETNALFRIFFVVPHAAASSLLFLDGEYLRRYRFRIPLGFALIGLSMWVLPAVLGGAVFLVLLNLWSTYHFVAQQIGIVRWRIGGAGRRLSHWKWINWIYGSVLYFFLLDGLPPSPTVRGLAAVTLVISGSWAVWVTARIAALDCPSPERPLLWASQAVNVGIGAFYFCGYPFLAILVPRVIHDVTALSFDFVHDANRNAVVTRNFWYRCLGLKGIAAGVGGILSAILIGRALYRIGPLGIQGALFLGMTHYFLESFCWKRQSPLRATLL